MNFRIWITCLLLLPAISAAGQQVSLSGNAPQFAGESFPVETMENPFTGYHRILDTLIINPDGTFLTELTLTRPVWLKIDFGIFESRLYAEPGSEYTLRLPPRRKKTEQDIRNPFFRPVPVQLEVIREINSARPGEISGSENLNARIFRFDTLIFRQNEKLAKARINNTSFNADSLIRATEAGYADDTSGYFRRYRAYRYGLTLLDSRDRMLKEVYDNFLDVPPQPLDPAYMDLFSRMFEKFLFFYAETSRGAPLKNIINRQHSLDSLRAILKTHPAIPDDTLADMVFLKEAGEGYYKDYFYQEALMIILDSLSANPSRPEFSLYAKQVQEKLKMLTIGSSPPTFKLYDQQMELTTLEDFRGKYVYLFICTTDNYGCLSEYPFIMALHRKHSDYLAVVSIMVSETQEQMKSFMERNGYDWTALFYGNDRDLLRDYNVKAYPVAYLIGPDGKLIQSPATLATEGFEQQLFRIMRSRGDL